MVVETVTLMPFAAKTPCRGCGRPTHGKYCEACIAAGKAKEKRPNACQRLYNAAWQRFSRSWLQQPGHEWCVGYPRGYHGERRVAAQLPDHIKAHKGDPVLFWDQDNLQPMCRACNTRKAVAEEGAGWRRV